MHIFKTETERFQLNANYANALRVAENGALQGVGGVNNPVYFKNGIPVETNTYGGGTAVTLNGASKASSTASFYAPTAAGTSGQVLTSSGGAPGWTNQSSLNVGSAAKWTTKRTLSIQGSVTGSAEIDGSGDITLNTITNHTHLYAGSATAGGVANSALKLNNTTAIGSDNVPVYFTNAGVPTACKGDLSLNTTGSAAKWTTARTITLAGSVTGSVSLDGSANVTLNTTTNHSHNYAGSNSAGGSANSAVKLDSDAGSSTLPVYFSGGKPVACGTSLGVSVTGSAAKWTTARTITLAGSVTGSVSLDGSANVTLNTTTNHSHSYLPLSGGSMTGNINRTTYKGGAWIAGRDNAALRTSSSASSSSFAPIVSAKTQLGSWDLGPCHPEESFYFSYATDANYNAGTNSTVTTVKIANNGALWGAVWNDYAEFRDQKEIIEPGYCVASADNGQVYKTTEKFQACDGIVSDTFGFAIGETDECQTPLAVAGRVLAYCEGDKYDYHSGDTVCAGPNGKVVKMTREEIREWPDRIVGVVSEIPTYETWGTGNVPVNGRIWIKVV